MGCSCKNVQKLEKAVNANNINYEKKGAFNFLNKILLSLLNKIIMAMLLIILTPIIIIIIIVNYIFRNELELILPKKMRKLIYKEPKKDE